MEYWRQCAMWLISCKVLPPNHRVTADTAQVFDLAQTLRDGVLLCQLLNNIRPSSIDLKDINLRPQMSQFLCLKNIRTFLTCCYDVFGMKKCDLFEAFDLFDVRDFGKAEVDVRSCCLSEIKQTEEKYTETLESIEKVMLLIYGIYCSRVEIAIAVLDLISKEKEDVRLKLEECARRANNGKFTLRDLLVVPMQRVLKYHLLLQELVKHTHDAAEKSNLKIALDAMKDLAQYVNEVKRDNETLREIDQYQRCIENLNQPLIAYGRPKGDGEVRLVSSVDKRKQDRHIFLFDIAVIICKRRGYNYEMKDVLDLHYYKVTNNPTSDREAKKWCYGFYITHQQGHTGFELFFKTRELKKKWLDQFEMAISNIRPDKANHNYHQFKMHTFERIMSCSYCHLLLRGIFNQGYLCLKCGLGAHKECLGRMGLCGRTGLPRMVVIRDYSGVPCPQCGPPLSVHTGDVIEVMFADLHSSWWQVFAGPLDRSQAEEELQERDHGTFLIRNRSKECTEYAVSINHSDVNPWRFFHCACFPQELVEYYKQHSLKEGFSSLDTTLLVPYRELSNGNMPGAITKAVMFCPRVVGIAVARYDFSSRDTRELSLLQGDSIKIFTKLSNGWWKGEVDGRVGWFPSTYVEEED
uniref:Vav 3 guanine nucleotide exchange factor b n=1 Tax=Neogobius melanostomus TaxID=47308 RepID=A0A8C6ULT5_9GOBI